MRHQEGGGSDHATVALRLVRLHARHIHTHTHGHHLTFIATVSLPLQQSDLSHQDSPVAVQPNAQRWSFDIDGSYAHEQYDVSLRPSTDALGMGGTFTLTLGDRTTDPIAWNATADM